ncbi:MAG: stage II sporulation protein R [Lachnospiraceae bacterium]|nr:stage II sporulation protein R [Lachnospiraceae bacterium]
MNLYKTALSALLIAPIIGGVSVQMIHGYQAAKEKAEQITTEHTEQIEQTIKMIEGEENNTDQNDYLKLYADMGAVASGEVSEYMNTEAYKIAESYEDASIYTDLDSLYDDIQTAVIRFHVRANSDSEEDQALKMKVRNEALAYLQPFLKNTEDRESAESILQKHISDIQDVSRNVILAEGYDYPVKVYLTEEEFPLKSYGDLLFPSGYYEALRIDIGDAEGGNWWCVVYPGLCFADVAGGVVVEDGKKELQHVLTKEEYDSLLLYPEERREVEYRSYFLELLKNQ